MSDRNYFIDIKDLNWSYGENQILSNVHIQFQAGKFYGIIGPNGSGKTTLLKNITRSLEPNENTVYLLDQDITKQKYKNIAQKIAVVPQNTEIHFEFLAFDIVLMGRTPYLKRFQVEREEDYRIAEKAMKMTNTWQFRDKKINELSGGERQRVIVARAMAQQTPILMLDEPISHLDIHHQVELMDTVKMLNQDRGITVIAVLHDLNLAAAYCDSLVFMNNGTIHDIGKPEKVLTEQNIKDVYNIEFIMMKNPQNGKPYIIPKVRQYF